MSFRRYRLRPPSPTEHVVGEVLEFAPADDLANVGRPIPAPIELTPIAPVSRVIEYRPEDDQARSTGVIHPDRRAAFLAELDRSERLTGYIDHENRHDFKPNEWRDLLNDPSAWEALVAFLHRISRDEIIDRLLDIGRGPLASYFLEKDAPKWRRQVISWLVSRWRAEWDSISDEAKRELVEHFAERANSLAHEWAGADRVLKALERKDRS